MGCGKPSLSFSLAVALGAAKLWAVAIQVFPFLLARNCRMVPSKAPNPANPSKRVKLARGAAKLWAVASQVFPFLLARSCLMVPSNTLGLPGRSGLAGPALGAAKLWSVASQVFPLVPSNPSKFSKLAKLRW